MTVGISSAVNIFDPVNDNAPPLPDFDYLRVSTDNQCRIEFTCKEGDGTENIFVFTIPAAGSITIMKNGSVYNVIAGGDGFVDGTAGDIDLVRVEEKLGANVCEIHILMARAA